VLTGQAHDAVAKIDRVPRSRVRPQDHDRSELAVVLFEQIVDAALECCGLRVRRGAARIARERRDVDVAGAVPADRHRRDERVVLERLHARVGASR
jgi:hypothetical protein